MNRLAIFNEFARFAQSDKAYYTWGDPSQVGCIEDMLAHFGLSYEFSPNSESMHRAGLEKLKNFVINAATDDQARMLYAIAVEGAAIPKNNITAAASGLVFVSMSMNSTRDNDVELIRSGIEAGIKASGNKPYFLDLDESNDDIKDKMFEQIAACKFLVADFTHHITGVYYEAGYARGIGKTVIHTCKSSDMDGLHFDINSKRAVVWDSPEALKERLCNRIKALKLNV